MAKSFDSPFWDNRYGNAGDDFVFGTTPNDFLVACADHLPPGPVLCLAEGEGRNAVFLAERGHAVTAMDQSEVGLAKAQQLAASRGVTLTTVVADLTDFVIEPGTWSAIVSIFCHLPPDLRRVLYPRVAAGLRPGGMIVLESYHPRQVEHATGGPVASPELLVSLDDVRDAFPGITWDLAHEIERDVVEGHGHTGRAAVTQLLGRR
ncbi:SAM-dependent methyltransferase [Synoicihabitans lomoniglobus]|uniref:Class I SAM-dependent methyltransferase n=1 Tax=Synoicihabitans lomoniglobus TaxID=2909285 RepID=A0AAE9ZXT0_9BACT|nr:class I SAM-dependent methyltransferase [Opitutaceae bacterium LMO-M01]WED64915.1 class I SAM-dependent methyltransferase [Opitutaceae bacterium LMO-M01]